VYGIPPSLVHLLAVRALNVFFCVNFMLFV